MSREVSVRDFCDQLWCSCCRTSVYVICGSCSCSCICSRCIALCCSGSLFFACLRAALLPAAFADAAAFSSSREKARSDFQQRQQALNTCCSTEHRHHIRVTFAARADADRAVSSALLVRQRRIRSRAAICSVASLATTRSASGAAALACFAACADRCTPTRRASRSSLRLAGV